MLHRLRLLLRRNAFHRDLNEEMHTHLAESRSTNIGGNRHLRRSQLFRNSARSRNRTAIVLGALPREVLTIVMMQGLAPVFSGLVLGAIGAVAVAFILRNLLFGIAPLDPLALIVVVAVLLVTGALACYLPARRASRIDPMEALRHE